DEWQGALPRRAGCSGQELRTGSPPRIGPSADWTARLEKWTVINRASTHSRGRHGPRAARRWRRNARPTVYLRLRCRLQPHGKALATSLGSAILHGRTLPWGAALAQAKSEEGE